MHPDSIVSAVINIISSFINHVPENSQIDVEEYLMKEIIEGMQDRYENTMTVKNEKDE